MITIGMDYEVLPGKEAAFEEKFRDVLAAFEAGTGHRRSRLYRQVDSPSTYLIHSEWDSREAFQEFLKSDAFRAVTNWGREQILAGRPRHRVYGDE
ncbi:MAG: antibiotic biosynthesis monooxygenase [Gemmatimonadetes bacterium]|nr:antibiotic biosynthesis monooxygenase [Gemmatimonadota bacterium]